jgi:hypothetical protein
MSPDPGKIDQPSSSTADAEPNNRSGRIEAGAAYDTVSDAEEQDERATPEARPCEWLSLPQAIGRFARHGRRTQSAMHIKPLHWYVACRLVLEGGFVPDDIMPRPPFKVTRRRKSYILEYDPSLAGFGERTILGGLKTKNVDVVVSRNGIGPVLAISCKGMTGALRNLTNRMEETIGEVTNIHITYPALVFGYLFLLLANREEGGAIEKAATVQASLVAGRKNDSVFGSGGDLVEGVLRFHYAMQEISGRRGVRDEISRYEAVSFMLVERGLGDAGQFVPTFPPSESSVHFSRFFTTLYQRYDERFIFGAPLLKQRGHTDRVAWSPASPALEPDFLRERFGGALDYEIAVDQQTPKPES